MKTYQALLIPAFLILVTSLHAQVPDQLILRFSVSHHAGMNKKPDYSLFI